MTGYIGTDGVVPGWLRSTTINGSRWREVKKNPLEEYRSSRGDVAQPVSLRPV